MNLNHRPFQGTQCDIAFRLKSGFSSHSFQVEWLETNKSAQLKWSTASESVNFRLYNLQGEVLITGSGKRVNTSSLPSGYYTLETMLNDQPKVTTVLIR